MHRAGLRPRERHGRTTGSRQVRTRVIAADADVRIWVTRSPSSTPRPGSARLDRLRAGDRRVCSGCDGQQTPRRALALVGAVRRLSRMDRRVGPCRRLGCRRGDRFIRAHSAVGSLTYRPRAVVARELSAREPHLPSRSCPGPRRTSSQSAGGQERAPSAGAQLNTAREGRCSSRTQPCSRCRLIIRTP
jgi:hypothetical protein